MSRSFRFTKRPERHPVEEAEVERRRIDTALEKLPDTLAAIEFGESVDERARSIMDSVRRAGGATTRQLEALENMVGGLEAWAR